MFLTYLHKFLTAPAAKTFNSRMLFWLSLSLTFAAIYGLLGLQKAFISEYVVQDDARQHLFWMRRFLDRDLFANDLIADYFQSVAPFGYTTFYRLFAAVGIDPILLSKFLPIVLGLITTGYCFGVCLQLLPVPMAGFIASLLLNQNMWMQDDLVSSTPRAFIYPLFLAFLYYVLRRSLIHSLVAIALLGLFYPPFLLLEAGILILGLLRWEGQLPRLSENRLDYLFCGASLFVALLVMLPYAFSSSEFGPVIAGIEARALPEFRGGRIPFFYDDPLKFWFYGGDSGIMRRAFEPPLYWAGLLLPILLRYPSRFPLVKQIASRVTLLPEMALASLAMFFAAHALLYKLFAPSRYTRYTLRFVLILAAGIALVVILDAVWGWARQQAKPKVERLFLALGLTALIGAAVVFYPSMLKSFPKPNYIVGEVPALYEFFQKQPKDILIASLSLDADNLPPFSQRSILVGWEYANPYHMGYYRQIRQRATDMIRAQYSQDMETVQNFILTYGIDFFLLDANAFTPEYLKDNPWFKQWKPTAKNVLAQLEQGIPPALSSVMERCAVFETESLVVLEAECIAKAPQK